MIESTRFPVRILSVLCAVAWSGSLHGADHLDPMSRLRREAPGSFARLEAAYRHMTAEGIKRTEEGEPPRKGSQTIRVAISGTSQRMVTQLYKKQDGKRTLYQESVRCLNDRVYFSLHRDVLEDRPFSIYAMERRAPAGTVDIPDSIIWDNARQFALAPVNIESGPARDLIEGKRWRVTSSGSDIINGQAVLRYQFLGIEEPYLTHRGVVEFLPERCWAIRRLELDFMARMGTGPQAPRIKSRSTISVDYGEDRGGIPIPKRVQSENMFRKATMEFSDFKIDAPTPEREFTLAAYGLPDATAPLADSSRSRLPYWFLGAGVATLVGAVAIWKRPG